MRDLLIEAFRESVGQMPPIDRLIAGVGAGVVGTMTLADLSQWAGLAVGVLTVLMLIPRVIIGWVSAYDKMRRRREDPCIEIEIDEE